jgi:hypothetical protein
VRSASPIRYRSPDEDSARWLGFPYRDGDIVISTRSKTGTTWLQTICALLVFQRADLPAPLGELTPWLDWLVAPRDEVVERLERQPHRRIIKTHTPLDGIPLDPRATYLVMGRHPLDSAVSLYHQGDNIDRVRVQQLTGQPGRDPSAARPPLHEWLVAWTQWDGDPREQLDSLPGVLLHLGDAWTRRHDPNVVLVHYRDLSADLDREMRGLAARLAIEVDEEVWPELVDAASFGSMRQRAALVAPDPVGVLRDRRRFFRHGTSGDGPAALTEAELARYHERARAHAASNLLTWLHGALDARHGE